MTAEGRGPHLRPERPEDEPFRLALFRETGGLALAGLALAGLDPALADLLTKQQFVGQAVTYRARYPDANFLIIECDSSAIGRMVVDDGADVVTLVDIALLAVWRGRGIGTGLLRDVIAKASGRPVRLSVDAANTSAQRLYAKLGFTPVARSDTDIVLQRDPAASFGAAS